MDDAQHRMAERGMAHYQDGYDDAKSEKCSRCEENAKIVIAHCIELIEYLESIDDVTIIVAHKDTVVRTWTTLDAKDKIKVLKELQRHMEYG